MVEPFQYYYSKDHLSWFIKHRNALSGQEVNNYYPIFYIFADRSDIAHAHGYYMYQTVCGAERNLAHVIRPIINFLTQNDLPLIENASLVYDRLKKSYGSYLNTKFTAFEPDFDMDRSHPFPVRNCHGPPRWTDWYETCRDMYEAGSFLFETLLDDGIAWPRIVRAVHCFAVVVYEVCKRSILLGRRKQFRLEDGDKDEGSYRYILHLHEYGFLVLKLLVKLYVQSWIDREGGWAEFRVWPERLVVSAQNLCVKRLISGDRMLRPDLPKALKRKVAKQRLLHVLLRLSPKKSDYKYGSKGFYHVFVQKNTRKAELCCQWARSSGRCRGPCFCSEPLVF